MIEDMKFVGLDRI